MPKKVQSDTEFFDEIIKGPNFRYLSLCVRPPGWRSPGDNGQKTGLHRHDAFEFTLVIDGKASVTVDEKEYILTPGMVSLVPPEFPHIQESKGGHRRLGMLVTLDPEKAMLKILSNHITYPVIANIPHLLEFIPEIEEYTSLQTMVNIQKIRHILEGMLLSCVDHVKKQDKNQLFYEKLVEHLKINISKKLNLEYLSKTFFKSQTLIESLVYKEFGCGVMQLFNRLKIDHACKLLRNTAIPIGEISAHLGYEDQRSFSRAFKKHTGLSPRDYQKQRGG